MINKIKPIELFRPYNRHNNIPLDITSVFYSYEDAIKYANDGKVSYPGQIVSVIDNIKHTVDVYVVAYLSNNDTLTLKEINSTNNYNGVTAFNYIGKYDTLDDIPLDKYSSGNICRIENNHYIYDGKIWDIFSLLNNYVSDSNDGIIKAEEYSTLINNNNMPSIYYNGGNSSVNANSWVKVLTSSTDTDDTLLIPTLNSIVNMVESINNSQLFNIEFTNNKVYSNKDTFIPKFKLVYDRRSGAQLKDVDIYKTDITTNGSIIQKIPLSQFVLNADSTISYEFTDIEYSMYSGNTIEYEFVANYDKTELVPAGSISRTYRIDILNAITWELHGRFNSISGYMPADGTDLTLMIPETSNDIYSISVKVPSTLTVLIIEYSNQYGVNVLDLFNIHESGSFKEYTFNFDNQDDTFNPLTQFIFKFKKNS